MVSKNYRKFLTKSYLVYLWICVESGLWHAVGQFSIQRSQRGWARACRRSCPGAYSWICLSREFSSYSKRHIFGRMERKETSNLYFKIYSRLTIITVACLPLPMFSKSFFINRTNRKNKRLMRNFCHSLFFSIWSFLQKLKFVGINLVRYAVFGNLCKIATFHSTPIWIIIEVDSKAAIEYDGTLLQTQYLSTNRPPVPLWTQVANVLGCQTPFWQIA